MKVPSWFVTARVRESMGVQAVQIQGRWGRGMNPRRLLISLFSLVVAMAGLLAAPAPSRAAKAGDACVTSSDLQLAKVRRAIADQARAGTISDAVAAEVFCDPGLLTRKYLTTEIKPVTTPATAATMKVRSLASAAALTCKRSTTWDSSFKTAGITAAGIRVSLYWCPNGWSVESYSGSCQGYITGWGQANGWSGGCDYNEYIYYTLDNHGNGGIHHATAGHWSAYAWPIHFNGSVRVDMWGHYNGTCDTHYEKTLRHYC
jgi:hypothetical protein